jgi:hypothetical protein
LAVQFLELSELARSTDGVAARTTLGVFADVDFQSLSGLEMAWEVTCAS